MGKHETSRSTYAVTSWIFIRLLGLAYLFAFWSLAQQVLGLIGHDGILPAADYMAALRSAMESRQIGWARFHLLPTLCWWSTSDAFLEGLAAGGAVLSALLVLGVAPGLMLPLLWMAYLSLSIVGRDFLSYQWDALLLETGLLALPLGRLTALDRPSRAVDPPRLARWLLWWLLFRLMLGSGLVKVASGDAAWSNLTALAVHYETQPLPTPLAWYASHLPLWFHMASTAVVLGVELVVPWLIFVPGRLRTLSALALVVLQGLIALTGNYAFFNLLTAALCLMLLDDASLRWVVSALPTRRSSGAPWAGWPAWSAATLVAALTLPLSVLGLANQIGVAVPGSPVADPLARVMDPLRSVNPYGLFAVMTTTRSEIIVEGSNDGLRWRAYEFFDKVGDERRRPPLVAPFQPRLDWQMWFAALGQYEREPWFHAFCLRLLTGSPSVLRLLKGDPFGGRPPKFVRGTLYLYRFAGARAHFETGAWWTRSQIGAYTPILSLGEPLGGR
jgi:hypothetical protein